MQMAQMQLTTDLGVLFLTANTKGLTEVNWTKNPDIPCVDEKASANACSKILKKAAVQIAEYFSGHRTEFDLPMDLQGTPFQKRVWSELIKIPYGQTLSYKQLAIKIRNQRAVRAVGGANGRNPVCIIVPCHRVIAHDGSLGGYSAGLGRKRQLLQLEAKMTQPQVSLKSL